jgi:hypothetical protein
MRFNVHRPDVDYFWLRPWQIVARHRALGGTRGFDLGRRFRETEPAFVAYDSTSLALRDSLVADGSYREVPGFRLLERKR